MVRFVSGLRPAYLRVGWLVFFLTKRQFTCIIITSVTTSKCDGTNASTKTFTYDTTHPDRLVSYNGTTIPYDSYGYPTTYNGYTLTWSRGRLAKMTKGTKQTGQETYSYTYIGAGSVVTKDIPANVIAVGNPCKVLREIGERDREYYFKGRKIDWDEMKKQRKMQLEPFRSSTR